MALTVPTGGSATGPSEPSIAVSASLPTVTPVAWNRYCPGDRQRVGRPLVHTGHLRHKHWARRPGRCISACEHRRRIGLMCRDRGAEHRPRAEDKAVGLTCGLLQRAGRSRPVHSPTLSGEGEAELGKRCEQGPLPLGRVAGVCRDLATVERLHRQVPAVWGAGCWARQGRWGAARRARPALGRASGAAAEAVGGGVGATTGVALSAIRLLARSLRVAFVLALALVAPAGTITIAEPLRSFTVLLRLRLPEV